MRFKGVMRFKGLMTVCISLIVSIVLDCMQSSESNLVTVPKLLAQGLYLYG